MKISPQFMSPVSTISGNTTESEAPLYIVAELQYLLLENTDDRFYYMQQRWCLLSYPNCAK